MILSHTCWSSIPHCGIVRECTLQLQRLADQAGLAIAVCHFPPGTGKWNKVEYCLLSFFSNWRGEPLRDYQTIVGLIADRTAAKGLKLWSERRDSNPRHSRWQRDALPG
jgi:Rhodopirellula transposase DDE domain